MTRLQRRPPPTWPSCRPAKVEQSSRWPRRCWSERRSSSISATTRRAKAILEEADTLVRGCADAGIASTLPASAERSAGVAVTSRNEGCAVGEELTPKELEVLRLLATRLSRREIGARLYVSLNTVKTHQRAVYRKLRVEHRSAAVSRARELGLFSSPARPRQMWPVTNRRV